MNCRDALNAMLEADPAILRGSGRGPGALPEHLRTCGRCRRVAGTLVAELDTLDAELERLSQGLAGADSGASGAPELHTQRMRRPRSGWRKSAWMPVAAAAVLAALLVLGRGGAPGDPAGAAADAPAPEPVGSVAVTVPADRGAAVLATADPKITVVWFYERSER